jgi:hypothetical protein
MLAKATLGFQRKMPPPIAGVRRASHNNTKYLTKVVFMPHRHGGYWSDKGYEWYGGT